MFFIFAFLAASNLQPTDIGSCQVKNIFIIKKFTIANSIFPRAAIVSYAFNAQLTSQVENPFLETQILSEDNRIPVFRYRDTLCRENVLNCPAFNSEFAYKNQIYLPPTLNPGNYILRFIFREGKQSISCYEKPFQISDKITLSSEEKKI